MLQNFVSKFDVNFNWTLLVLWECIENLFSCQIMPPKIDLCFGEFQLTMAGFEESIRIGLLIELCQKIDIFENFSRQWLDLKNLLEMGLLIELCQKIDIFENFS